MILATYNEAENLTQLVEALEDLGEDLQLVVVDDDSPDGTGLIAQQLSSSFGNITIINRSSKQGLGSALQTGLAVSLNAGAQYVMTMDADLSHDPADVLRLLSTIKTGSADMVQGSRYAPGGAIRGWNIKRRLLSRAANLVYHWGAGTPQECTTNFRVFSRRLHRQSCPGLRATDTSSCPSLHCLCWRPDSRSEKSQLRSQTAS